MSSLKVGNSFTHGGFRYVVRAVMSDRPGGGQAVVEIVGREEEKPEPKPGPAVASGLAAQLLAEALDPIKAARHLGYCDGLKKAAEFVAMAGHGDMSGTALAYRLRDEERRMREGKIS